MGKKIFGGILHNGKVLKVMGTKGEKGDSGQDGATGAVGPQGPQGVPFTYNDFTQSQLEALRGPQGIQGIQGPQGDSVLVEEGDLPLAHVLGQDNTKAISQKGATDAIDEISFFREEQIDLSRYAYKNGVYIGSTDDKWHTNVGNNGCKFIPVTPGDKYRIYAAGEREYSHCIFLTSNTYVHNQLVDTFAGGNVTYTSWPTGEVRTVPEDATYLYVRTVASGTDITPTVYRVKSVKERLTDLNDFEDVKNTLETWVDESVVDEFEFTGRNTEDSHTLVDTYAVPTVIGRRYKIVLSNTTWNCSKVSGSANAMWLHHSPNGTETSTTGRVVDEETGRQLYFSRPSAIWSNTFTFLALNNYVTFNFRGDEGETLGITVSCYPEITHVINGLSKEVSSLTDDEIIDTQNYVGQCSGGNSAKSGGCFPVVPGEVYKMDFSTISWDCSGVQNNAAALIISNATASTLGDGVQSGRIVDLYTQTSMRCNRPSNMPGNSILFVPKLSWVQIIFRANIGEELSVTLTKLSKMTQTEEQVNAIEQTVENLKEGIGISQDIVSVNGGFTELDAKFQALIRPKSGGNKPCILLHFSDLHGYSGILNRILEFDSTFSTYIDDMIHTGDTANNLFGDPNRLQDLESTYVLNVIGNHDYWVSGTGNNRVIAEQTQVYEKYIKPFADYQDSELHGSGITQPENAESLGLCYYYKDYAESKLRLIVLDCMYWDNEQNTWFAEVLEDARTLGYSVLCADHYCPHSSWTPMRECTFQSVVAGINTSDAGSILAPAAAATLQAAIDNGLQFVCWIFGHHHRDQFGYLADYPTQFAMAVDKAANNDSHERDSKRMSTGRTVDCFNIIAVDTTCKIMTVMRIGNNRDKFMRQKNYLVLDYANGKILHNS